MFKLNQLTIHTTKHTKPSQSPLFSISSLSFSNPLHVNHRQCILKSNPNHFQKYLLSLSLFFSFYFSKSFYCCSNVASLPTHKPTKQNIKIIPFFSSTLSFALDRSAYPYASPPSYIPFQSHSNNSNKSPSMHMVASSSITLFFFFLLFFKLLPLFHSFYHIIQSVLLLLFDCILCVSVWLSKIKKKNINKPNQCSQ